ncbi:MAG: flagellar biosynthetic protein FliR [Phycisphaerales bacterium]|nr:flagellar biosynthetic protein FliR [Phycisphaerales bacterium]
MPTLGDLPSHAAPFLLVLFRLSGVLVFAPLLSSALVPAKVRLLLCIMFAVALYPALAATPAAIRRPAMDLFALGPAVVAEVLVGLSIGLMAALPMFAVQLGGWLISQQGGLTVGMIYNPALDLEADLVGQFLLYVAMIIFIALGGLEILFITLAKTFASIPAGSVLGVPGGVAAIAPLELFTGLVSSGFELALRVSAPVLCIILIETLVTAIVGRTMPQMSIQSIDYPVKLILVFVTLAAAMASIAQDVGEDYADTLGLIMRWADTLGLPR